jgi:type I restriction enzyme S subunit
MTKFPAQWNESCLKELGLPQVASVNPHNYPDEIFELFSVPSFEDGQPERLSGKEINSAKQFVEPGDILLCKIVPHLVRVWLVPARRDHRQIASGEWIVVRPDPQIALGDYVRYALIEPGFRSAFMETVSGVGGSLMRARPKAVARIPLPLPPLPQQTEIVSRLDNLLTRSRNARGELYQIPALAERYKQAVLAAAFRGEFTARWRDENNGVLPVKDFLRLRMAVANGRRNAPKYGRDERSALIEHDQDLSATLHAMAEVNDIPGTWDWCGIGEVFGVYVGATPSRKEPAFWDGDVPWVSSGEVAFCSIRQTAETISEAGLRNTSTRLHPPGTVLLGMIGEGKTRGQAAILDIEACNNQNCAAIRVSEADYPPKYVYWYLYAVYEQTRTAGSGNNQPALNKDRVQRLPIPLAPPEEAAQVVQLIETYLEPLDRLEAEVSSASKILSRLDNKILEQAFRGELTNMTFAGSL